MKPRICLVGLFFLFLIFGCSVAPAEASFAYKATIVTDHTKVPSTQTNFPVLVILSDATIKVTGSGGQVTRSDGNDLRFYSDSGLTSALTYQRYFYDSTNGIYVARVLISSLSSSSNNTIYAGYGDAGVTTDGSSTSVWDASMKGMWALGDGTTLSMAEFTSNAATGTNHSATATSGQVDGAAAFVNASSQYIDATGNESAFDSDRTTAFSVSLWIRHTAASGTQALVSKVDSAGNAPGWGLDFDSDNNKIKIILAGTTGDNIQAASPFGSATDAAFHHIALTFDGSSLASGFHIYIDASDQTLATAGTLASSILNNQDVMIGRNPADGHFYDGKLDELRISTGIARSANWYTTEYNNESNNAAFFSSLTYASNGGGGGGTTPQRSLKGVGQ